MPVQICIQPKTPGRPVYKQNCGVCASLSFAFSSVAPISLVLCFTNSSTVPSWISDLALFSPARPLSSVWVPHPWDVLWKLPPGSKLMQPQGSLSLFSDHRPALSVSQCLKNIALCTLSTFLVVQGRRVLVSPVFK